MIKGLTIKNFQSHKLSVLEFHPGVNIIVGSSDSGKSAIVRSLRLVRDNRPLGDSYRSNWGGDTQIDVELTEGVTVSRVRTKSKNGYVMGGSEYNAIGSEVPKEITDTMDMGDHNLQYQFDRPFLLDNSPGEVAAHFNALANLEVINTSQRQVESEISRINQRVKLYKEDAVVALNKLEALELLDKYEAELEVLESLGKQLSRVKSHVISLKKLINDLRYTDAEILAKNNIIKWENEVNGALELSQRTEEVAKQRIELEYSFIKPIKNFTKSITQHRTYISEVEPEILQILQLSETKQSFRKDIETMGAVILRLHKVQEGVDVLRAQLALGTAGERILEMRDTVKQLGCQQDSIRAILSQLQDIQETRITTKKGLRKKEQEYEEGFPDQCPLCDTLKEVTKHGKN